ncbi:MAG: aspartate kinase, partial [Planctomycetota bacterium]|nr:aspartate kinase [Planctomycetota bacterium]
MHCAKRAVEAHRLGQGVVVVVSAMGQTTDELVERARQITSNPSTRELDLLLSTGEQISSALMTMAIQALGAEAISFTSHHLGIITDPVHCSARIRSIDRQRIGEQLEFGRIVVAAGFQGVTEDGQVTTLGRGGSDLTAVALAAALGVCDDSGACEI